MFFVALLIFAFNLWDLWVCIYTVYLYIIIWLIFVLRTPFTVLFTPSWVHILSLFVLSLNSVRSGGSPSSVHPKSSNKCGFMHSFPFLPNFLKSGSTYSTFSAMVVFLTSVMWNVDSTPWLFFTSTKFPLILTTLKSSLNLGWNAFDVSSCMSN